MSNAVERGMIDSMGAVPTVIHLELARAGESLTGRAYDDGGGSVCFDGRLGLLAVIDALVEAFEARQAEHDQGRR